MPDLHLSIHEHILEKEDLVREVCDWKKIGDAFGQGFLIAYLQLS
jgi:hypothetical protein